MSEDRREILNAVAEGRISPQEAAELLDALDAEEGVSQAPPPSGINRLRLSSHYRKLRVIGDPAVREAVAEGAHAARHEGDTLVIDDGDEDLPDTPWFRFGGGSWDQLLDRWVDRRGQGSWRLREDSRGRPLTVRVNPDLPLEVAASAGSLWLTGTRAPLRVEVLAGSAYLEHVTGPLDVVAHMGSVKLNGVIDSGTSRIRCEAGSVYVQLLRGSSVRVRARSVLGRVALPEPAGVGRGSYAIGDDREVVVGGGAALLEIETNMGSVKVGSDA